MFLKNFQRKSLKINMDFSLIEKTILKLSGRSVRIKTIHRAHILQTCQQKNFEKCFRK